VAEQKPKQGTSTKDFVVISEIRDSVAILKDGSLRSVIEVASVNFDLKSLDEQTAIIGAFQNFLNSIDFPLQIGISSRKLDIAPYIKSLDALTASVSNELMKIQAVEYTRFIKGLTELANIMSKKFYIVVPLHIIETISASGGAGEAAKGFFGALKSMAGSTRTVKTLTDQEFQSRRVQLDQRVEFLLGGISGLGLEGRILNKDALMNMYYSYYNPGHNL